MSTLLCLSIAGSLLGLLLAASASAHNFKAQQMKYPRVRAAAQEKGALIRRYFRSKRLPYPPSLIFVRIFKREQVLELWASDSVQSEFTLLKEYRFCATSGGLGPKRREGDGQIPEGFYFIDRFNPLSNFHLSLGLNYPNDSDKVRERGGRLGGDIFIHGGCATIGCVPITDEGIKELYLIAVEAISAGQSKIPVHIFPARLSQSGLDRLKGEFEDADLASFWESLKPGYDFFEEHRTLPEIAVDKRGRYRISN